MEEKSKNKSFIKILWSIIKFFVILFAIAYIGVIIGYSVIGNGKLIDIFSLRAIKHVLDVINN